MNAGTKSFKIGGQVVLSRVRIVAEYHPIVFVSMIKVDAAILFLFIDIILNSLGSMKFLRSYEVESDEPTHIDCV